MSTLTKENGLLEVSIMNAEYMNADFNEVAVELLIKKLPKEIITRLKSLWEKTKVIAGEVVQIGKIIILKILDFIKKNSNIAVGIALGVGVGAIIGMIPFIGPLLQPLVTILATLGFIIIDDCDGKPVITVREAMESTMRTARKFFELLSEIFLSVKDYWETK